MDAVFRASKLATASLLFLIGGCNLDDLWSSNCDSWGTKAMLEQIINEQAGRRSRLYELTKDGYTMPEALIYTLDRHETARHSICSAMLIPGWSKDDPKWDAWEPTSITYTSQMIRGELHVKITKGLP